MEDLLDELDDMLYDLCSSISQVPFFMVKLRWDLKAKIKQTKTIIKLTKEIKKENDNISK